MNKVFWLKKGIIAGRTGPNADNWDLNEIKACGFSAILSVNDGEAVHETLISNLGMDYSNIPMSPNAPIRKGDKDFCLNNLPRAMAFIRKNLKTGPILIHCRSGKDRTGMVLAAYLIEFEECSAKQAMDIVLDVRPIAFSAEGWVDFGIDVLSTYESQNK